MTWRVGLQYLTEQEYDAGKEIPKSKRYIWSEAIVPTRITVPNYGFEKAFGQSASTTLPDPLGTTPSEGDDSGKNSEAKQKSKPEATDTFEPP